MNQAIKMIAFIWLMGCALFCWIGCAIIGFIFAFSSNMSWMYSVTPFIGFASAFCIIRCAMYVLLKSNPIAYLNAKMETLERLLGKEKI